MVLDTSLRNTQFYKMIIKDQVEQSKQRRNALLHLGLVIFTNPSARAGYDTRSIFKRSLTGLNSETSCLSKAEEPSLPYYLPIAGGRIIGFIPFPRALVLCEMQSVSSRIWTRVVVSISYDDNHYTTGTSLSKPRFSSLWKGSLRSVTLLTLSLSLWLQKWDFSSWARRAILSNQSRSNKNSPRTSYLSLTLVGLNVLTQNIMNNLTHSLL